jgi:serine/threonine protein kinase
LIGTGGFGKVFKSRNRFDGNYYALKRIALDCSNAKLTETTKNEAVLLARIQHPNIVRYY